jgi:hypothetical protein
MFVILTRWSSSLVSFSSIKFLTFDKKKKIVSILNAHKPSLKPLSTTLD